MIWGIVKKSYLSLFAIPSLLAAGIFSMGASLPAESVSATSTEIGGYTKSQFVESAAKFGVEPEISAAAWGNEELMAKIPVKETISAGQIESKTSAMPLAVNASYSGTCSKDHRNLFNGVLASMSITKNWSTSGSAVVPQQAYISVGQGYGWAFQRLTVDQEYYGAAHGSGQGAHTTNKQGLFTAGVQGDSHSINISITAYSWSPYTCS